jgi:hypothetical protein
MSFKRFAPILALLSIALLFSGPVAARADTGTHPDTNSKKGCTGSWTFPPLYVGGDDGAVFAQATYELDENCNPVQVDQVRLDHVPASVTGGEQKSFETKSVPIVPSSPDRAASFSPQAVNTCHVQTWEQDVVGAHMIASEVDQTYSWNGSTVTLGSGSVSATTYFAWWHRNSGPSGAAGYYNSQVAYANGQAGFYCDGWPFCPGGPNFFTTLYENMTVDYQGGCGGYGSASGTIVPGGSVSYNVWK